jgi:hypothetical protein
MPPVNVSDLLRQPTDKAERPALLPDGHFTGTILRHEFDKSRQKKTPLVRFFLNPTGVSTDLTEEDIEGINLKTLELRLEFYLTPKSMYRLADFLDGVLGEGSGEGYDERLPETNGANVIFGVRQRLNDEGKPIGNEVTTVVGEN